MIHRLRLLNEVLSPVATIYVSVETMTDSNTGVGMISFLGGAGGEE
jgi:hypothetical protein